MGHSLRTAPLGRPGASSYAIVIAFSAKSCGAIERKLWRDRDLQIKLDAVGYLGRRPLRRAQARLKAASCWPTWNGRDVALHQDLWIDQLLTTATPSPRGAR